MAGNLRSPRKRALDIGTDPSKFVDGDYDSQAGVPKSHPSSGEYEDRAESARPSSGAKPRDQHRPIK